ncbi:MAG: glycosyltransferase family 2 protein [Lachnospiraceae bacterium]|nr:glycosyltransferase family 2 protein [Lachnospiraceae bacterium]
MDATIVIPVYNGGSKLKGTLAAIKSQSSKYSFEVVVIDSGSTDKSQEAVRAAGFKLYEIPNNEFGHGRTRNLGASKGSGRYIIFLTQDAMPASQKWLDSFIEAMDECPEAAGAFGRHIPYPECNLPDKQMLENHFLRFSLPDDYGGVELHENYSVFSLNEGNKALYEEESGYRQYLGFYSDNSSCMRRSVWEKMPYPDVDFAEDQAWAAQILEAGYKKLYVPGAVVYHSHDYSMAQYKKRYYEDYASVYRVHGEDLAPTGFMALKRALGETRYNISYIRRQEELDAGGKLYWSIYALRRNLIRYNAAYRAVRDIKKGNDSRRRDK